jgi:hypothetical protein
MAVAVAKPTNMRRYINQSGAYKERTFDVTLTGSYATGGEAITASTVGFKEIYRVQGVVTEAAGQTTEWIPLWDQANGKMKLFGAGTGATGLTEHAAAAYATATAGRLTFVGI